MLTPQRFLPSGAWALNSDHDTWVLRDTHAICGYNPLTHTLCWRLEPSRMSYLSPATLHSFAGHVVTCVQRPAGSELRGLIVAVRPGDGAVLWSVDVSEEAARDRPVLRLGPERFLNLDPTDKIGRIVRTDDGSVSEVLHGQAFVQAWSLGDGRVLAQPAWDKTDLLLIDCHTDTISATPMAAPGVVRDVLRDGERRCVAWQDRETGRISVSVLDPEAGQLTQTIPLPEAFTNWPILEPAGARGRLWVWSKVHTDPLALLDLDERAVVWSGGRYEHDPVIRGDTAIVAIPDGEQTRIVQHPSGETLAEVDVVSDGILRADPAGLWLTLSYLPEDIETPIDQYRHDFSLLLEDRPAPAALPLGEAPPGVALKPATPLKKGAVEAAQDAVRAALRQGHGGDWPGAFREIRRAMGVRALKASVKARLKMLPADASVLSYNQLFGAGPADRVVPALLVERDGAGHYTLLNLKTGALARTHHDNYDELGGLKRELLEADPAAFLAAFFARYG